jgi:hypothetical protein
MAAIFRLSGGKMNGIRLICSAAAIALVSGSAGSATYKPHVLLGSDILAVCSADNSAEFCEGFLEAVDKENGNRFLARTCPPALVRGHRNRWSEVQPYLAENPSRKKMLASDVVFHAETAQLSRALGQNCREK